MEESADEVTVQGLCRRIGFSRQAYYKERKRRSRKDVDESAIVDLVKEQRTVHPRIGTRKLMVLVGPQLADMGISIGRDRLFVLLRARGLLVERKRRFSKTTDSRHGFRVYPNLIRHIRPCVAHQVWVSDLTYIRTDEGFMYLSLVTDAYSRKIVGYDISESLEAQGCVRALKMALRQLPEGARPIHHSDRGIQYCSHDYIGLLHKHGCAISMTGANHCYENAQAERVNGILKHEYLLVQSFRTKPQATKAASQAIMLYNEYRPHTQLNYRTPASVHAVEYAA